MDTTGEGGGAPAPISAQAAAESIGRKIAIGRRKRVETTKVYTHPLSELAESLTSIEIDYSNETKKQEHELTATLSEIIEPKLVGEEILTLSPDMDTNIKNFVNSLEGRSQKEAREILNTYLSYCREVLYRAFGTVHDFYDKEIALECLRKDEEYFLSKNPRGKEFLDVFRDLIETAKSLPKSTITLHQILEKLQTKIYEEILKKPWGKGFYLIPKKVRIYRDRSNSEKTQESIIDAFKTLGFATPPVAVVDVFPRVIRQTLNNLEAKVYEPKGLTELDAAVVKIPKDMVIANVPDLETVQVGVFNFILDKSDKSKVIVSDNILTVASLKLQGISVNAVIQKLKELQPNKDFKRAVRGIGGIKNQIDRLDWKIKLEKKSKAEALVTLKAVGDMTAIEAANIYSKSLIKEMDTSTEGGAPAPTVVEGAPPSPSVPIIVTTGDGLAGYQALLYGHCSLYAAGNVVEVSCVPQQSNHIDALKSILNIRLREASAFSDVFPRIMDITTKQIELFIESLRNESPLEQVYNALALYRINEYLLKVISSLNTLNTLKKLTPSDSEEIKRLLQLDTIKFSDIYDIQTQLLDQDLDNESELDIKVIVPNQGKFEIVKIGVSIPKSRKTELISEAKDSGLYAVLLKDIIGSSEPKILIKFNSLMRSINNYYDKLGNNYIYEFTLSDGGQLKWYDSESGKEQILQLPGLTEKFKQQFLRDIYIHSLSTKGESFGLAKIIDPEKKDMLKGAPYQVKIGRAVFGLPFIEKAGELTLDEGGVPVAKRMSGIPKKERVAISLIPISLVLEYTQDIELNDLLERADFKSIMVKDTGLLVDKKKVQSYIFTFIYVLIQWFELRFPELYEESILPTLISDLITEQIKKYGIEDKTEIFSDPDYLKTMTRILMRLIKTGGYSDKSKLIGQAVDDLEAFGALEVQVVPQEVPQEIIGERVFELRRNTEQVKTLLTELRAPISSRTKAETLVREKKPELPVSPVTESKSAAMSVEPDVPVSSTAVEPVPISASAAMSVGPEKPGLIDRLEQLVEELFGTPKEEKLTTGGAAAPPKKGGKRKHKTIKKNKKSNKNTTPKKIKKVKKSKPQKKSKRKIEKMLKRRKTTVKKRH